MFACNATWEKFQKRIREIFAIDFRALALFRIALGALILLDLAQRAPYIWDHYTDRGLMPRAWAITQQLNSYRFSLHYFGGTVFYQSVLFAVAAVAAVSLVAGYRTRVAVLVSWVMLCSLQARNFMVLQGGDIYLRVMMFWAMFLPLGERFSVDAVKRKRRVGEGRYFSVATCALMLQVCSVYLFTSLFKEGSEWHSDQTAVPMAMMLDHFASPLGLMLRPYIMYFKPMTPVVVWFEFLCGFLLVFPVYTKYTRRIAVAGVVAMHFGFFLFMRLGLFPWICMAGMIPFFEMPKQWVWHETAVGAVKLTPALDWRAKVLVMVSMVLAATWNIATLFQSEKQLPAILRAPTVSLNIDQKWNMFAPKPFSEDGWFVIAGTLVNGTPVDLFRKVVGPVDFSKPEVIADMYPNSLWRKYYGNLWLKENADQRLYFGKYLCRLWNDEHQGGEQVSKFEVFYMLTQIYPDLTRAPAEKRKIWGHDCFARD